MRTSIAALLIATASVVSAQPGPPKADSPIAFTPDAIVWKDAPATLPAGSKMAVLEGNPAADGMFTMRVRIPAGSAIPPHWHPRQERVTIISGAVNLGFGSVAGTGPVTRYGAGSFYVNPPRVMHYLSFPELTEMQMTGVGPWELQTSDVGEKPGAVGTATVNIRTVSPAAGTVVTPSTTIKATVDYNIQNFKPATYFMTIVFETPTPGRTFGIGPHIVGTIDHPPSPPRPDFLTSATGSATLTQDLDRAFSLPEVKHPIRVKILVHEQLTESSSRIAGSSDWIEFRQ
jgi:quercetin dioxygenase-like cupin family protein